MNCSVCGQSLHPLLVARGETIHPTCTPPAFAEPANESGVDPFAAMIKSKLTEIIVWQDKRNPRSLQEQIGPSEVGDPCQRRVGYRLASVPACNDAFDPWVAVVGTAIHSWMENAVRQWAMVHGEASGEWVTEATVQIGEFLQGHVDLYQSNWRSVIDYKSVGADKMKQVLEHGPEEKHKIQVQCYGLGCELWGLPVEKVALVHLPRSGLLKNMYVWTGDYDRAVAEAALERMYATALKLVELDVLAKPYRWEDVEPTPSNSCGLCPWYDPKRENDIVADHTGCGGR